MGLFDIFKKSASFKKEEPVNFMYDLLFCDDITLLKNISPPPYDYPWDVLFSETVNPAELQKLIDDNNAESRIKILAYNKLLAEGQKIDKKELLGIIIEVGLDNGLDVLASFRDGRARYINQTGAMIIWETPDENSTTITNELFNRGLNVVKAIGSWDKPRRPPPKKGMVRITFLVSDGLYFGEGPMNVLFSDPLTGPVLTTGMELMKYIMEKSIK